RRGPRRPAPDALLRCHGRWLSRRRRGRRGAGGRPSLHTPHGAVSLLAGLHRRLRDLGCLLPFGSDEDTGSAPAPLGADPSVLVHQPPSGTRRWGKPRTTYPPSAVRV